MTIKGSKKKLYYFHFVREFMRKIYKNIKHKSAAQCYMIVINFHKDTSFTDPQSRLSITLITNKVYSGFDGRSLIL